MNWKPHTEQPNELMTALFATQAQNGKFALADGIREWLPESRQWVMESTSEPVTESVFWWLAEDDMLAPLEAATPGHPDTLKAVYYWLDGYWITDKEEADLMDEINAFGSTHGTAYFPLDAEPAFIDGEIKALLAQQAGQACT